MGEEDMLSVCESSVNCSNNFLSGTESEKKIYHRGSVNLIVLQLNRVVTLDVYCDKARNICHTVNN